MGAAAYLDDDDDARVLFVPHPKETVFLPADEAVDGGVDGGLDTDDAFE